MAPACWSSLMIILVALSIFRFWMGTILFGTDARLAILAFGTDGTDGPTDAAGAFADAGTLARGASAGVDARVSLAANDAYSFFSREGGLLVTGPTGTNVMDIQLVLVDVLE